MSKDGSVAPKERINIRYVPATLGQQEEVELPLRVMVVGDFLGRPDETRLEERATISVDKNNFNAVMEEAGISRDLTVRNVLSADEDNELTVSLNIRSMQDFAPDSIVRQVPELRKLSELREALVALKGPLGNMPAFRQRMQTILDDEDSRARLLAELQSIETSAPAAAPASGASTAAAATSPEPSEPSRPDNGSGEPN